MKTLKLDKYGIMINQREVGDDIFSEIFDSLQRNDKLTIDFKNIRSMATFCAKQIFGKLYLMLTPNNFYQRIYLQNVNEDLKIIIQEGINNALEEEEEKSVLT